jgi:2-dehydropantoate 2-reductase
VGAGSLGLALGASLAQAGNRVTLLARPASASALREAGQVHVSGRFEHVVPVSGPPGRPGLVAVTDRGTDLPPAQAVLFTTKGQDLAESIESAAGAPLDQGGDGALVAGLQNGVVKDELLALAFGPDNVVGAATVLGARRTSAGSVSITSVGTTFFGEFGPAGAPAAPGSRRADNLAAAFVSAGLPCVVVPNVRSLLWSKFCNAIGVFGVSALTRLPTALIFARRPLALAYRSLLEEAAAVAVAEGAEVGDFPDLPMRSYLAPAPEEFAATMAARAAPVGDGPPGYSSMAQDLAAGRRTEVEETFGDLVRRARAHDVDVPLSQLVYRVVTGLEAR